MRFVTASVTAAAKALHQKKSRNELTRYETYPSVSGADGNRTHDPRLAKPVLSQLSYRPKCNDCSKITLSNA